MTKKQRKSDGSDEEGDEEEEDDDEEAADEENEEEENDEEEEDEEEEDEEEEEEDEEDDEAEEDMVTLKVQLAGEGTARVLKVEEDIKFKAFMKVVCGTVKVDVPACAVASPSKKAGKKGGGKNSSLKSTVSGSGDSSSESTTRVCYIDNEGDSITIDSPAAMEHSFSCWANGVNNALKIVVHRGAPPLQLAVVVVDETIPTKSVKPITTPSANRPPLGASNNNFAPSSTDRAGSSDNVSAMSPLFSGSTSVSGGGGGGNLMRAPTPSATGRHVSSEILLGSRHGGPISDITVGKNANTGDSHEHTFAGLQEGQELRWNSMGMLGRGSFGTVHEGITGDGLLMAVKVVELLGDRSSNQEEINSLMKEINLMRRLDHRNVVAYYGCQTRQLDEGNGNNMQLQIFLEHCPGGTLTSLRKKFDPKNNRLSMQLARHYTRSVLEGLAYLHSQNLMHRDIKGDNVLIGTTGEAKLADFGCSRRVASVATTLNPEGDDLAKTLVGTPLFMAPEMVNNGTEGGYSYEADIWALGCLTIEMFGRRPWSMGDGQGAANVYGIMFKIASTNESPNGIPPNCPPMLQSFFDECFVRNPKKRKGALAMLDHPFMTCEDKDLGEILWPDTLGSPKTPSTTSVRSSSGAPSTNVMKVGGPDDSLASMAGSQQ